MTHQRYEKVCEHCSKVFQGLPKQRFCSVGCNSRSRSGEQFERNEKTFWANVATGSADECWLWLLGTMPNGRARMHPDSNEFGEYYPYRVAWRYTHGEIPADKVLDHVCNNPLCCNPSHLRLLSAGDNVRRHFDERGTCANGHPRTPENTSIETNGKRTYRRCEQCRHLERYH